MTGGLGRAGTRAGTTCRRDGRGDDHLGCAPHEGPRRRDGTTVDRGPVSCDPSLRPELIRKVLRHPTSDLPTYPAAELSDFHGTKEVTDDRP